MSRYVLLLGLALTACGVRSKGRPGASAPPQPVELTPAQIAQLLPPRAASPETWGEAVWNGLMANDVIPTRENACGVIAVIAQESGFEADPAVPGLSAMVKKRLDEQQNSLPLIGRPLFKRLLSGRSPHDARPFAQRLDAVRTERDLDVVFRDMLAYYKDHYPTTFAALNLAGKLFDDQALANMNPITTAGSMQVSVQWSEKFAEQRKGADPKQVRDALYTIPGGVYYGTARLMGFRAAYDKPIYRFADYNAGVYASRNAALQAQVGTLTDTKLVLDGDFLAYEANGEPKDEETQSLKALKAFASRYAPHLSERRVRKDAGEEKTEKFEKTETFKAVKAAFEKQKGRPPLYAVLPQVAISSPKLSRTRSTSWFAQSVDRRYSTCVNGR